MYQKNQIKLSSLKSKVKPSGTFKKYMSILKLIRISLLFISYKNFAFGKNKFDFNYTNPPYFEANLSVIKNLLHYKIHTYISI